MERIKYVIDTFASAKIEISEQQAVKYVKLCEFMVEYNKIVNLTAITDIEDVVM